MRTVVKGLLAAAALAVVTATAQAGVSVDIDIHSGPPARVYAPPVYDTRVERVWIAPVTQTVVQNTWHEPVTEDRVDRTWVQDRYEVRNVPTVDQYGRPATFQQQVLVEPAHWQDIHTPVVVRAGYFGPEATSVVVTPGYWQTVTRQVLVRSGPLDDCGPIAVAPPLPPPYRDDRFRGHYDGRFDDHHGYDRGDRYHR